jgi:hypothetical protein
MLEYIGHDDAVESAGSHMRTGEVVQVHDLRIDATPSSLGDGFCIAIDTPHSVTG